MGMYNLVFGRAGNAAAILSTLGLTEDDFGRFRDVWVSGGLVHVYTRCGGGNREDYDDVFRAMRHHPQYDSDWDDDFDCTYCTFTFSFPTAHAAALALLDDPDHPSGEEQWDAFLTALRARPTKGDA